MISKEKSSIFYISTGTILHDYSAAPLKLPTSYVCTPGISLDLDTIVLRRMDTLVNIIGEESQGIVNNAVLSFVPGYAFLACAIKTFLSPYQSDKFSENGPALLTKLLTDEVETCPTISSTVNALPASAFQPIHWSEMKERLLSTPMEVYGR